MKNVTTEQDPVVILNKDDECLGNTSSRSIGVAVHGYWSDVITISVSREMDFDKYLEARSAGKSDADEAEWHHWQVSVSHSSGGRNKEEVADDLIAEMNFANGIAEAIKYAQHIRAQVAKMEERYQEQQAARREAAAVEEAKRQARINADAPYGTAEAVKTIYGITERLRGRNAYAEVVIRVVRRGDEHTDSITVYNARDGSARFKLHGHVISRADATTRLANGSHRSNIIDLDSDVVENKQMAAS